MALSADDKLVLVRVKAERARKHLGELKDVIGPYRNKRKGEYIRVQNRQPGTPLIRHMELPIIPFDALAAAGDVVQNLRSALDHLVFQLFVVGSPDLVPTRELAFPISKSFASYERDKQKKLLGLRSDAVAAIDALKPYRGGNEPLWMLHTMNNLDKHRFLLTEGKDVLCEADWLCAPHPDHPYFWLRSGDPSFSGVFGNERNQCVPSTIAADENDSSRRVTAMIPTLEHLSSYVDTILGSFRNMLE